jgi:hypothetical protein
VSAQKIKIEQDSSIEIIQNSLHEKLSSKGNIVYHSIKTRPSLAGQFRTRFIQNWNWIHEKIEVVKTQLTRRVNPVTKFFKLCIMINPITFHQKDYAMLFISVLICYSLTVNKAKRTCENCKQFKHHQFLKSSKLCII